MTQPSLTPLLAGAPHPAAHPPDRDGVAHVLQARLAVSKALRDWRGVPHLLQVLGVALGAEMATLWLPEGDVLVARDSWTSSRLRGSAFVQATRRLRLAKGTELPGWAWQRRAPVHLPNVTEHLGYRRRAVARSAGVRTGVAFPVLGDDVLGVIDLHWRAATRVAKPELLALAGMGYEIGTFLCRRQGELDTGSLTRRELEVLRLAADGLGTTEIASRLTLAPSTIKTHFDHIYEKLGVSGRVGAVAHAIRSGLID